MIKNVIDEIGYAGRKLRASLGTSLTSVLILAVAIGANAVVYTLADYFFSSSTPGPTGEDVFLIGARPKDPGMDYFYMFDNRLTVAVEERVQSFSRVTRVTDYTVTLSNVDRPQRVHALRAGAGSPEVIPLKVVRGRSFLPADFQADAARTILLGFNTWTNLLGGREDAVGRLVSVNGVSYQVIGVLSPKMMFEHENYDVVLASSFKEPRFLSIGDYNVWLVGTLKPGVSQEQAIAEVKSLEPRLSSVAPSGYWEQNTLSVREVNERSHAVSKRQLRILLASSTVVLLIAAFNVCSVALVRLNQRRGEYATRVVLGAKRWDLLRLFAIENGLLVLSGYVLGVVFGWGLVQLVRTKFQGADRGLLALLLREDLALNRRVLGLTLLACLVVIVFLSLITLVFSTSNKLAAFIKEDSRSATGGKTSKWTSNLLLFLQISSTCGVMVFGGFFLVSFKNVRNYDYGCSFDDLVQSDFYLPYFRYAEGERAPELVALTDSLVRVARSFPEISAVSLSKLQFPHWGSMQGVRLKNSAPDREEQGLPQARQGFVTPGFFEMVGIRLISGQLFSHAHDSLAGDKVVIVNEAFVSQYLGESGPLDQYLEVHGQWHRVIGVVNNVRRWQHESGYTQGRMETRAEPAIYFPNAYDVDGRSWGFMYIKTRAWSAGLDQRLRAAIQKIDPDIVVGSFGNLRDRLNQSENTFNLIVFIQALVASIGSVLSSVAIYSAVSYSVAQRKREIGIRMALGAKPGRIRDGVLWQTARLVAPALLLGVSISYLLVGYLEYFKNQIYLVNTSDWRIYTGISLSLLAVCLLASLRPALKAASVNPNDLLRDA